MALLITIDRALLTQSRFALGALSLLLIAIIGAVDFWTGPELSFSVFYLLPIGLVAWYLGGFHGYIFCILSITTWFLVDMASAQSYSNAAIPYWNAGVRLGFFIIIAFLLTKMRTSLEIQATLAQTDGLTGLINSRTFKERCQFIFELASRNKRAQTLGYIDLDGFKGVNDNLGHHIGDLVLKGVAETLSLRLRSSDVGARLGGDEFAVLLPDTDLAGAKIFFASLQESLLTLARDNGWPIGYSVGVAVFTNFGANIDEAIKCSDNLMYKVKDSGKNAILYGEFTKEIVTSENQKVDYERLN